MDWKLEKMISISSDLEDLGRQLENLQSCVVLRQQYLSKYTSYCIGGQAAFLVAPQTEDAIIKVLRLVHEAQIPFFVLGHGSNILVADTGWPGVVLYFGRNFSGWRFEGETAIVKSGTHLIDLVQATVARGLSGMEQLAGIPGSVGGALCMNAGAFGKEIQAITKFVYGYQMDGTPFTFARKNISFGYRSAPELNSTVITAGKFRFTGDEPARLMDRMEEILSLRSKKQPLEYPSCGSVFKRPPGYYAGALIEGAGLKEVKVGNAMVSPKHCGFILNLGNATANDVYQLMQLVEERVWDRYGVRLEREVQLIGNFKEMDHV
jgi:UDP-N-acetylmuramate dehydrogenase